jgi:hypothetical protein
MNCAKVVKITHKSLINHAFQCIGMKSPKQGEYVQCATKVQGKITHNMCTIANELHVNRTKKLGVTNAKHALYVF